MKRKISGRSVTRFVAYTAVMTALTYVGTLIGFGGAQFYFNLGDTVILICAALFGPVPAMIAGGLGAFLGDLTVYPATMVFTLFIKAIEGLVAGLLFMSVNFVVKRISDRMFSKHSISTANADDGNDAPVSAAYADDGNRIGQGIDERALDGEETRANDVNWDTSSAYSAAPAGKGKSEKVEGASDKADKRDKIVLFAIKVLLSLVACVIPTALMMTGYFVCQTFFYGTYAAALIAMPMDAMQAAISSALAVVMLYAMRLEKLRTRLLSK